MTDNDFLDIKQINRFQFKNIFLQINNLKNHKIHDKYNVKFKYVLLCSVIYTSTCNASFKLARYYKLPCEAKKCTILCLQKLCQNFIYYDSFWHTYTSINFLSYVRSIFLYRQRRGTSFSFKSTAGQRIVHTQLLCSFVARRRISIIAPNL